MSKEIKADKLVLTSQKKYPHQAILAIDKEMLEWTSDYVVPKWNDAKTCHTAVMNSPERLTVAEHNSPLFQITSVWRLYIIAHSNDSGLGFLNSARILYSCEQMAEYLSLYLIHPSLKFPGKTPLTVSLLCCSAGMGKKNNLFTSTAANLQCFLAIKGINVKVIARTVSLNRYKQTVDRNDQFPKPGKKKKRSGAKVMFSWVNNQSQSDQYIRAAQDAYEASWSEEALLLIQRCIKDSTSFEKANVLEALYAAIENKPPAMKLSTIKELLDSSDSAIDTGVSKFSFLKSTKTTREKLTVLVKNGEYFINHPDKIPYKEQRIIFESS